MGHCREVRSSSSTRFLCPRKNFKKNKNISSKFVDINCLPSVTTPPPPFSGSVGSLSYDRSAALNKNKDKYNGK
jgi:hypothetical protein